MATQQPQIYMAPHADHNGLSIVSFVSGIILMALGVLCLVPSPANAATQITVTGVVHCHGGAVEGVWVVSSGGGSGWASVHSFTTGNNDGSASDVRYGRTFSTTLPSAISFHVGCGGSLSSWRTSNYSPSFSVGGSRTLNLFCGNDKNPGPCSFPPTGNTTNHNLGISGFCTEGALNDFHAYNGIWPYWTGNAAQWANTASTNRWDVTTIPMPKSIVVFPATSTNSAGHVAWVVSLDTNSAGVVTGLYVHEENYDGSSTVGTGHTRYFHYALNSTYRYIVAPSPH